MRDSIVDLEADPGERPTRGRDRLVIASLLAACATFGAAVVIARAPQGPAAAGDRSAPAAPATGPASFSAGSAGEPALTRVRLVTVAGMTVPRRVLILDPGARAPHRSSLPSDAPQRMR